MGSQIQTHIFIQGLIRKELFPKWKWQHFFLYPFGHCYRHAIRRWLSPIPDMAETINWPNGALAIDILAHIVLMTSKTTRFGRWCDHKEGYFYIVNTKYYPARLAKWGWGDQDTGTFAGGKFTDQLWNISGDESS